MNLQNLLKLIPKDKIDFTRKRTREEWKKLEDDTLIELQKALIEKRKARLKELNIIE